MKGGGGKEREIDSPSEIVNMPLLSSVDRALMSVHYLVY